jgi:hypothetical protein
MVEIILRQNAEGQISISSDGLNPIGNYAFGQDRFGALFVKIP